MTSEMPRVRSAAFTETSVPENYEQRLARVVFEPWAEILLSVAGVAPGDRVLDVAAGTGVVARLAARRSGPTGEVIATDISAPMLARAAAHGAEEGAARIVFTEASALELPFEDGGFDVVLCQQGLQFFPDRETAVAEMRRVLRPGGAVGASVWSDRHPLEPFDHFSQAARSAGIEPPFPGALDAGAFVLSEDAVRAPFLAAGFTEVELSERTETISFTDTQAAVLAVLGTPFGPAVQALAADRRERLDADLAARFAPEEPGGPVRRQSVAFVLRAIRPPDPGTLTPSPTSVS